VVAGARPVAAEEREEEESGDASLLDPFLLAIAEKVAKGITTTRILRELQEEGYEGGRTILAEHVRSIRPKRVARREQPKRRFETDPGKDYAERGVMLSDGRPAASEGSALRPVRNPPLRIIPMAASRVRRATARKMHDRPDAREGLPTLVLRRGSA
ncbi:MAG: hypothetical protein HY901_36715, partial [Deltaproteobacteria bacterium]|nr:hypothetical protein [Deltaproteobacteria bacterium]